jgi:hypothetical protein
MDIPGDTAKILPRASRRQWENSSLHRVRQGLVWPLPAKSGIASGQASGIEGAETTALPAESKRVNQIQLSIVKNPVSVSEKTANCQENDSILTAKLIKSTETKLCDATATESDDGGPSSYRSFDENPNSFGFLMRYTPPPTPALLPSLLKTDAVT